MTRVGFFLIPTRGWMGGVNYFKNLFASISAAEESDFALYLFIPNNIDQSILNMMDVEKTGIKVIRTSMLRRYHPYWFLWRGLNKILNIDVAALPLCWFYKINVVSHSDFIYLPKIKLINWIPDFQHMHLPEMFKPSEVNRRNISYAKIIHGADRIIVSSEDAAKDLLIMHPNAKEKIAVLKFVSQVGKNYWRLNHLDFNEIQRKYNIKTKYFYVPNQFWIHKNHIVIAEAVRILKRRGIEVNIVCTGMTYDHRNPEFFNNFVKFIQDKACSNQFQILGLISYSEVFVLMRFSMAVINPSLFEGWSTTVEECKSAGKKMILSEIPVHKEQYPEADFFKADDAYQLAKILLKHCNSSAVIEMEAEMQMSLNEIKLKDYGKKYLTIIKNI